MIGVLIHVNGTPIELLNIVNMEFLDNDLEGKCLYTVSASGKVFEITHFRRDGYEKLVSKALLYLEKLNKKD